MGLLRKKINEKKASESKLYGKQNGYKVDFNLKKLFVQMNKEKDRGLTPELFKEIQRYADENHLKKENIEDLKLVAKKYLELKGLYKQKYEFYVGFTHRHTCRFLKCGLRYVKLAHCHTNQGVTTLLLACFRI